jgi:hypothetical protein
MAEKLQELKEKKAANRKTNRIQQVANRTRTSISTFDTSRVEIMTP